MSSCLFSHKSSVIKGAATSLARRNFLPFVNIFRYTSNMSREESLVSPFWLASKLKVGAVKVLDTSWFMPADGRNPSEEYTRKRISNSQFFDIDKVADATQKLPHMLPSIAHFEREVQQLGLSNEDHIVCYDTNTNYFASARVWWTFRVFGHQKISILDQGLNGWEAAGFPIETSTPLPIHKGTFVVKSFKRELVKTMQEILENIDLKQFDVIDARSSGRFSGLQAEPRQGLRSGHIPGSCSFEFAKVLRQEKTGVTFHDDQELKEICKAVGVNPARPLTASCGSGISAAVLAFALHLTGKSDVSIYDGSWSEYGKEEFNNPIQTNNSK